jgi:hypothetical protein
MMEGSGNKVLKKGRNTGKQGLREGNDKRAGNWGEYDKALNYVRGTGEQRA